MSTPQSSTSVLASSSWALAVGHAPAQVRAVQGGVCLRTAGPSFVQLGLPDQEKVNNILLRGQRSVPISIGRRELGFVSRATSSDAAVFDICANLIHNQFVRESFRGNAVEKQGAMLCPLRVTSAILQPDQSSRETGVEVIQGLIDASRADVGALAPSPKVTAGPAGRAIQQD